MSKTKSDCKNSILNFCAVAFVLQSLLVFTAGAADYYTEPQVYGTRPNSGGECELGPIGVTGIQAYIYKGVRVTVEKIDPDTPAYGKFDIGDIIIGLNGAKLKGKNPLVVLGTALTEAEATDGLLSFDITPVKAGKPKQVTIKIPVLGAYSSTFPLKCAKSDKIIEKAAEFYAGQDRLKEHNLHNPLACLFLLSTGDDKYVPRVKEYFAQFLTTDGKVKGIADHSWYNGYNGVAVSEYYLRTGDRSVLPILQHYCDDARKRQKYGIGWGHWGYDVFPAYEAGGGMQHAAGTQILLTLVLGKVCGVDVDDKTLLGALKHWYRFAGHGAIPIADQRYWHIFRSAGRDGATAAVMQIASRAKGDTSIYKQAHEYLSMSSLTSWPARAYNWEVIWHSISGANTLEYNPDMYYQTMQRFRWMYDLHRQESGAFYGHVDHAGMSAVASGISLALAYTAPLKNLAIQGAPRSKYAVDFTLPEHLWGTEADRAFLSAKHNPDFYKYGKDEEIQIPFWQLPLRLRYTPAEVKNLSLNMMLKNVRHARSAVRTGAAKALCMNKRYGELEKLLRDPDPRLRRAALDGINDCRPWFTEPVVGKYALKAEAYTSAMIKAINKIMSDPKEAWFVIDGALNTLSHAPTEVILQNISRIIPWTTNEDWWLRKSAFNALMGLQSDKKLFAEYLPAITDVMIREYSYNPRHNMVLQLQKALAKSRHDSPIGKLIIAGFTRAALQSEVRPDVGKYLRSLEGTASIIEVALTSIKQAPEASADLAEVLVESGWLNKMDTANLMKLVKVKDGYVSDRFVGLFPALKTLSLQDKKRLSDILFKVFRPELIKRLASVDDKKTESLLIDIILDLTRLKKQITGWQAIGSPRPAERIWRYYTFDPLTEKDKMHPRVWERFRTATLPTGLDKWFKPEFDDSQWKSGTAPIGVGEFIATGHGRGWISTPDHFFKNNSDWGDGEFLLSRTTFEVTDADLDYDYYRLWLLTAKGYTIYLNGNKIRSYPWSAHFPSYEKIILSDAERKHLKKGVNTLAVYCIAGYGKDKQTEKYHPIGQIDLSVEALKKRNFN